MGEVTRRPCPGCASSRAKCIGPKNGFEIFACLKCGSLYTSRLPAADETEDYDAYYTEDNLTAPEFIVRRLEEIVGGFERYRRTGRLLDIGFGAGTILDVASRLGWSVSGQEVSATAVDQAKRKGYDVFCGDLATAKYPDEHFDLVTCSEILEHVPDPQALLNEVGRILRPGGLLWATTPSARGISFRLTGTAWSVLSPPEHTQLYSKKGLTRMLVNAGFRNVKIRTHGTNPGEIAHYYRTKGQDQGPSGFNRVESSFELNEKLTSSRPRQVVKALLNAGLDVFGIGDSLKVFAER